MHEKFSNCTHKVLYCLSGAEGEVQIKSRPLISMCSLQLCVTSVSMATQDPLEEVPPVWLRKNLTQMPALNYIQRQLMAFSILKLNLKY